MRMPKQLKLLSSVQLSLRLCMWWDCHKKSTRAIRNWKKSARIVLIGGFFFPEMKPRPRLWKWGKNNLEVITELFSSSFAPRFSIAMKIEKLSWKGTSTKTTRVDTQWISPGLLAKFWVAYVITIVDSSWFVETCGLWSIVYSASWCYFWNFDSENISIVTDNKGGKNTDS